MHLLEKSTYSQSHDIDGNPTKQLEESTEAYLHTSFLLWEYKQNCNKKEYRELLQEYGWDKGATEQRRALKLAEHYQDFVHRPHALFQIPITTLLTHIPHPNCHKRVFTEYFFCVKNKNELAVFK